MFTFSMLSCLGLLTVLLICIMVNGLSSGDVMHPAWRTDQWKNSTLVIAHIRVLGSSLFIEIQMIGLFWPQTSWICSSRWQALLVFCVQCILYTCNDMYIMYSHVCSVMAGCTCAHCYCFDALLTLFILQGNVQFNLIIAIVL